MTDNGANFIGARRELDEIYIYQFLQAKESQDKIQHYFKDDRIEWTHIPAHASHIGGIWETTKTLLYKVLGMQKLNFEEFATILSEI